MVAVGEGDSIASLSRRAVGCVPCVEDYLQSDLCVKGYNRIWDSTACAPGRRLDRSQNASQDLLDRLGSRRIGIYLSMHN